MIGIKKKGTSNVKYVIKNIKSNMYYKSTILKKLFHFVADIDEACVFNKKIDAKKVYNTLYNLREFENFEIIKR